MTQTKYQQIRETIGSREEVAGFLGVTYKTVWNRERSKNPRYYITREAALAIIALARIKKVQKILDSGGV